MKCEATLHLDQVDLTLAEPAKQYSNDDDGNPNPWITVLPRHFENRSYDTVIIKITDGLNLKETSHQKIGPTSTYLAMGRDQVRGVVHGLDNLDDASLQNRIQSHDRTILSAHRMGRSNTVLLTFAEDHQCIPYCHNCGDKHSPADPQCPARLKADIDLNHSMEMRRQMQLTQRKNNGPPQRTTPKSTPYRPAPPRAMGQKKESVQK
ncbi:hypothetical protein HPB47_000769, partial [Ixodes persulcatus]